MHRWNWDDLRLILAVAEHGSLAGAARQLGVNHTTVLRRVNAFEEQHAMRLFDRLASGYAVTSAGSELLDAARDMKHVVGELERKLIGQDRRLEGVVRVTTCDSLMASLLPHVFKEFRTLHSGIVLETTTGNFVSSLAERHADVALRTGDQPSENLIGQNVATVEFAIYGAKGSEAAGAADPLSYPHWIAPDGTLSGTDVFKWMKSSIDERQIIFKADSFVTLRQAATSGIGLVILPCYLGDTSEELVKLPKNPVSHLKTGLWVLTHPDLRHTTRVRVFASHAATSLKSMALAASP